MIEILGPIFGIGFLIWLTLAILVLCAVATLKTYEKKPLCFSRIERTRHFVKIWRRSLQRQRNKTD
jgi:uncharacterized protein with PQ loop repeat